MSKWTTINKEHYIKLAKSKLMTSTHVRKYELILENLYKSKGWNQ